MKNYIIFSFLFALCTLNLKGQEKRPLEVNDLKSWKSNKDVQLSNNGEIFSYEQKPQVGEGSLFFGNAEIGFMDSIKRATKAQLAPFGEYVIFTIEPPQALTDSIKLAKQNGLKSAKKAKAPKDSVGLYFFGLDTLYKYPNVVSYKTPKDSGDFFFIHLEKSPNPLIKEEEKDKWWQFWGEKNKEPKTHTPTAKSLLIGKCDLLALQEVRNVKTATISEAGNAVAVLQANTDTLDSLAIQVFNKRPFEGEPTNIWSGFGEVKSLTFDPAGKQLVFLQSADTNKQKQFDLWYWKWGMEKAEKKIDGNDNGFPASYSLSEHGKVYFSDNGKRLFFGYGKKPKPDQKDTVLSNHQPKLDLWSWTDDKLQTMQLKSLKRDMKKSFLGVFNLEENKVVVIADSLMDYISLVEGGNADFAIGIDDNAYKKKVSWEWPPYRDWYRVNLNTGERQMILKEAQYAAITSPNGKYMAFYHPSDEKWHIIPTNKTFNGNLSSVAVPLEVKNKEHDTPMEAYPYGWEGWSEDSEYLVLKTEFDLFLVKSNNPKEVTPYTKREGEKLKVRFNLIDLDREEEGINLNDYQLLIGFDEKTKESRIYKVLKGSKPEVVYQEPNHTFRIVEIARFSKKIIWSMMNFETYPDLFYSSPNFEDYHRISFTNPQQNQFKWGSVELTKWQIPGGDTLEGLIFKPENFDVTKKYPTLVYFYETYSDLLHRYYSPRLSASIINPTHYVSHDYVVFIPDIVYRDGHPGISAVECVVSGTQHLIEKGFVDEKRIGIQGQSWGGYQSAFIITQTNMFAAAMAGAPVSNMTSAYGGIRWGSGYSRMFQYEETQSRIGKTLWEAPELYIENSPLFHLDKVETPLLIMHNDDDGAVPWYQGIELFVGMRRLNKPAWMLTYNGDKHNLRKWPNKVDLTIRMKQFFDFYLKDEAKPKWMEYGIPAIKKGEDFRYERLGE